MIEDGFNDVYFIESKNALGNDNEGTVDSVHFTDLGYMRYADYLIRKFVEFGLINITD